MSDEERLDYVDMLRRCCRCQTFKYHGQGGTEASDGAYLCRVCTAVVLGEWPGDTVESLRLEIARLKAENEGLKLVVLNCVTEDARACR